MALKIQTTAYAALEKGLSNEEVLELVKKRHPKAQTTLGCISYYRSKMNKELPANQRIPQKAKVLDTLSIEVNEPTVPMPVSLQNRLVKALEKLSKLEQEIYELEQQVHSVNAA